MISFEDFLTQDEADKYNMLQECNSYIKSKDREIKWLENQLQQKENIIKEVREYIKNHSKTNIEWWITGQQKIECKFMDNTNPQELLEILDKESK